MIEEVVVEEAYVIDEWTEIVYDEYEAMSIKKQLRCIAKNCSMAGGCVFAGPGILKCIAVVCVGAAIYCTVEAIEEILKK